MAWVNIKDQLPQYYEYVLVYAKLHGTSEPCPTSIARLDPDGIWQFVNERSDVDVTEGAYKEMDWPICRDDITHWMPLPGLPNE